mgnify:CR=1 FL=1
MKKITYFNVLVFTVLLLTMGGCNEDKFLKEDPRDALYPENLLVDYNGFRTSQSGCGGNDKTFLCK